MLMQIPPNNIPVATKQQGKDEQLPKSPMEFIIIKADG